MFALPIPEKLASGQRRRGSSKRNHKRHSKRNTSEEIDENQIDDSKIEYQAVVTPEERSQRRLARHPLQLPLPPLPFPHSAVSVSQRQVGQSNANDRGLDGLHGIKTEDSLRITHIRNMITILHTSLEQQNYGRAMRALGLILRTPLHGSTIDIRHGSLWSIGAELLCRNNLDSNQRLTPNGWNLLRQYHDRLSLQYPWQRSWPTVVNAQDFKLNLYNLWIYTTVKKSDAMLESQIDDGGDNEHYTDVELRAKCYQLEETEKIGKDMDSCMTSIPFVDDIEFIRLRLMVAWWTSDLVNDIENLRTAQNDQCGADEDMVDVFANERYDTKIGDLSPSPQLERLRVQAESARVVAQKMMARLT